MSQDRIQHVDSVDGSPDLPADLSEGPILVWLRQDLRLRDNPALYAAANTGRSVIVVYLLPDRNDDWFPGGAASWWLHHSLDALTTNLHKRHHQLILRSGSATAEMARLAEDCKAAAVFWNRCYEPADRERDEKTADKLAQAGYQVRSFPGSLLIEPWTLSTKQGDPYQVFTPFWKAARTRVEFASPLPAPESLKTPDQWPDSEELADWKLLPTLDWADEFLERWKPGEDAAHAAWQKFLDDNIAEYGTERDVPSHHGTSRLSPHLHYGEISPRLIYADAVEKINRKQTATESFEKNVNVYLSEIGWREFGYHVLYHFPHTPENPLREKFADFNWETKKSWLKAWQQGQTGYPIVDAGMRELWRTGWMHNRVRMIVASFLTKDLRIHWLEGAKWFWDTLVDADLANNTLGWQWASGCGADAAPYFRVFNPTRQSEKFDPEGNYLRRWCPELADLPDKYLHCPADAPKSVLNKAGVQLGKDYPEPIVDHAEQREAALAEWEKVK